MYHSILMPATLYSASFSGLSSDVRRTHHLSRLLRLSPDALLARSIGHTKPRLQVTNRLWCVSEVHIPPVVINEAAHAPYPILSTITLQSHPPATPPRHIHAMRSLRIHFLL
jgi:hypothetical protein